MLNKCEIQIKENYSRVLENVNTAVSTSSMSVDQVKIVVVSKIHKIEIIQSAINVGIRTFGENYIEEALGKIEHFSNIPDISWHMIGHVQSRKANFAAINFDLIHSVDNNKLASRLDRFAIENNRKTKILVECNISGEESKFGYPAAQKSNWGKIAEEFNKLSDNTNIEILGLMTMPPIFSDPEESRPYFIKLRELRDYLAQQFPHIALKELSMGTSTDYKVAVAEGASIVRIGTAILGSRY